MTNHLFLLCAVQVDRPPLPHFDAFVKGITDSIYAVYGCIINVLIWQKVKKPFLSTSFQMLQEVHIVSSRYCTISLRVSEVVTSTFFVDISKKMHMSDHALFHHNNAQYEWQLHSMSHI